MPAKTAEQLDQMMDESKNLPQISVEEMTKIRQDAYAKAVADLQAESEQKAAIAKAETERRFPVLIKRDYWAKDDVADQWPRNDNGAIISNRIVAGTIIKLPITEARRLIQAGVAERADDIPDV